ncbi:MAG: putative polymerase chi subunit [Pseudomonadota bacterium]|jgi:DNA polymerase-3 subunit chi
MTGIAFHVNLADRLAYACRLLRKAAASGSRVVVTGPQPELRALDTALWTFSAPDFLPHGMADTLPPAVLAHTPIVLAASAVQAPHRQVLVNLDESVPEGFEGFERLIELVSGDEPQLRQARVRWKHYADRGYAPTKIDQKDVAA